MKPMWVIRLLDVLGAAGALALLGLPMGVISALIWREDRGPVLFRQERVGREGRAFTILKFRTMVVAPDTSSISTGGLAPTTADRSRFETTTPNDPRITRVGAHLRRTHLDELPQLLNVIRGDMSLVGVRPDTGVQEVDYPPEFWVARHRLRPGITGPAQLKSDTADLAERSRLDLQWVQSPTIRGYLGILVATVMKVAHRTGL